MAIDDLEAGLPHALSKEYKDFLLTVEDYTYLSFNDFPNEFSDDEGIS